MAKVERTRPLKALAEEWVTRLVQSAPFANIASQRRRVRGKRDLLKFEAVTLYPSILNHVLAVL